MKKKKYKLLILGGSGFLGNALVNFLKHKYKISSTYKKNKKNIKYVKEIKLDLTNSKDIKKKISKNYDIIINCSGYIDHKNFSDGGYSVIDEHLVGIINLLNYLNIKNIKHFIQLGSSDEYGSNKAPQKEEDEIKPFSIYSFAKSAATNFLITLNKTENFPSTVIRPFLVYGPGQDQRRFIPQIIKGGLEGKSFPTSEGNQLRDFLYIKDFCKMIEKIILNKKTFGSVYNLGSGKPITIKNAIKIIIKKTGNKGKPQFGLYKYRKGENMKLYPDMRKLNRLTKLKSRLSFSKGIINTIRFYKKNS